MSLFFFVVLATSLAFENISESHASAPAATASIIKNAQQPVYGPSLVPKESVSTMSTNQPAINQASSIPSGSSYNAASSGKIALNEQFNGNSLNAALWQVMDYPTGYRNNEEEDYSTSQVRVNDGALEITAVKDSNGAWHSGEVDSKWHYKYGDFSVRLALSVTGPGVWPAAWLMGTTGQWPTNGEIDIMENLNGSSTSYGTIHGGGSQGEWQLQSAITPSNILEYHTYEIKKQPNDISWWVDGIKQAVWKKSDTPNSGVWPFESYSNFGILNLAIGGNWPGPTDATTPSVVTMYVDSYVITDAS